MMAGELVASREHSMAGQKVVAMVDSSAVVSAALWGWMLAVESVGYWAAH